MSTSLEHIRPWMLNATRELSGDLSEWLRLAADLFARGERYPYAILLKDGTYVGNAGATPHDDGTIELGYWVHAAHLRRGYMTEAVEALMEAFAPASFVIHCHEDNLASQGVARKAGFTHAGFDARGTYREMRWERVVPPR